MGQPLVLEATREAVVVRMRHGSINFYVRVSFVDNQPAEVFITGAKMGAALRDFSSLAGILISIALRQGTEWQKLKGALLNFTGHDVKAEGDQPAFTHLLVQAVESAIEKRRQREVPDQGN